ncbi:glycosyltransferase family 39 protein [Acetobacter tropicalis]|nr:glycosyltransferase family 39 protein [Acetobacter tropicalis]
MPQEKNNIHTPYIKWEFLFFHKKNSDFTLKYIITPAIFIYVLSYALVPFSNGDPAFYSIVGRGLVRDHILPYHYAFDHKPLGNYIFYGIWDCLIPFYSGKFTLLAITLSAIFVGLCRIFGNFSQWTAFILLTIGGSIFDVMSGNSELVVVTGEALCLSLMLRGIQKNRNSLFFLAGIVASFIINVNYLAAVCLLGPVAFLLLSPGWFRISRSFSVVIGGLVGLGLLFSPYLMPENGSLYAYFSMQHEFLRHYSGTTRERIRCLLLVGFYVFLMWPVLAAWYRRFPMLGWTQTSRKNFVLPLWFLSSIPATLLSGHPFDHYFQLCFAPAVIMWAILLKQDVVFTRYAFIPFFMVASFSITHNTLNNFKDRFYHSQVDYAAISKEVGQRKVLNIRAYQTVFYLSDLKPFDIYLFRDHIDVLYGRNAGLHYMDDLQRQPPYVVMSYDACERHEVEMPVCQWVQTHYQLIYSVNVRRSKPNKLSLSLYKLVHSG